VIAFDPRPLTDPVDRAAAREFTRRLRAEGRLPASFGAASVIGLVLAGVIGVFVLGGFLTVFLGMIGAIFANGGSGAIIALPFLFFLLLVGGLIALGIVAAVRGVSGATERRYRLDAFARANGMSYVPSIPAPRLPGMIFGQGSSRQASDLVRGDLPRFVEFANYRYTTGSGKNQTTHRWGYVAVKLDVPLPHIVLDALGNNGMFGSNLPASFDRDQRLSLEGDFDRYFSLSCPSGYERDALYLFTPDIMARFIDNAAALDVEIVDDWLFLYAKRDLSTLDPATWAWMFTVVAALLDKLAQWARWRDDRLTATAELPATDAVASGIPGAVAGPTPLVTPPPPILDRPAGVAPGGRRLKRRVPVAAFVILGLFGLWWVFSQLGGVGLLFGSLFGR
jgi:hypothetical protein